MTAASVPGEADRERKRHAEHIERLRRQHEWGDLSDSEYRKARSEVEAAIAALPAPDDTLAELEALSEVVTSVRDVILEATPETAQPIVAMLVERVAMAGKEVVGIEWLPEARAHLAPAVLSVRPRTDSNRRRQP